MSVYVLVLNHVQLFVTPMDSSPPEPSVMGFSDKNTGVGCHFLLQVKEVLILLLLLFSHQESESLQPHGL